MFERSYHLDTSMGTGNYLISAVTKSGFHHELCTTETEDFAIHLIKHLMSLTKDQQDSIHCEVSWDD